MINRLLSIYDYNPLIYSIFVGIIPGTSVLIINSILTINSWVFILMLVVVVSAICYYWESVHPWMETMDTRHL